MWSAECGVKSARCGVWSVECAGRIELVSEELLVIVFYVGVNKLG